MFTAIVNALILIIYWTTPIIFVVYLYLKIVVYSYWRRHGIPHETPTVPIGNLGMDFIALKLTLGERMKESYEKFKKHPFHGFYTFHRPTLVINDPKIIKYVLITEFSSFQDRGLYCNEEIDPLLGNLFFLTGDKWKFIRKKLTATFSSGKLKNMYPFLLEVADELINVTNDILLNTDTLDVKDLVSRYTTDTIFSIAFGFNAHSLTNPDSECRRYGDRSLRNNPFLILMTFLFPTSLEFLKIRFFHADASNFFIRLFKDMVEQRKRDKIKRKDFLNLLIELMDGGGIEKVENNDNIHRKGSNLELIEATAQAFVFFLAGFETTSSLITYTLYELALNPQEQEKVYEEIHDFMKNEDIRNYESMSKLKYLNMAMSETVRKHPTLPFLNRICVKDCKLPNSDFVVPKGMRLLIPTFGIQRDANNYPDPDKYDPSRFSSENVAARDPFIYLTFGEGPRMCIGMRLGMMMSSVALVTLLNKYKFLTCSKTPMHSRYSADSPAHLPKDVIYLRIEKRNFGH